MLTERGALGFNAGYLIETGEEVGSPGLREVCAAYKDRLAADVLIASDGPRLAPERPTIFLGARGAMIRPDRRPARGRASFRQLGRAPGQSGHHPGACAGTITDGKGAIQVREWGPTHLPNGARRARRRHGRRRRRRPRNRPAIGASPVSASRERVRLEQLRGARLHDRQSGEPRQRDPAHGQATCQLRFVVGVDPEEFLPALRRHLDAHGFPMVAIARGRRRYLRRHSSRSGSSLGRLGGDLDRADRPARRPPFCPISAARCRTTSLPMILGLPTVWVPHSYAGCSQHAPNEHMLAPIAREALGLMAGLFWDLGDADIRGRR